ncbi:MULTISPECIES: C40 family peptidase [Chitinophagaceae]
MNRNWKLFVLLALVPLLQVEAQSVLNPEVAKAVNFIEKNLKPDHQSQYFHVSPLSGDSLLVETTSEDAVRRFDSIFPHTPRRVVLLPEPFPDNKNFGIVKLSVTNHRAEPAQSGEMLTQGLMGSTMRILKKVKEGYFLVQTTDNYIAFVETSGIVRVTEAEKVEWETQPQIIFTQLYGTVYSENSDKSLPVSDIVAGDCLALKGEKGKYFQVAYPDGKIGYVLKTAAQKRSDWFAQHKPNFDNILTTGKKLIGVPYLWGGTSIKGVDCSGFMRTCFGLNGILLPRDASQQARVGEQVDLYENGTVNIDKALQVLQSGDLLFFGTKRDDGSDKVTHVAMYIGNGKFIQSSGYVKISDFSPSAPDYDAYHMSHFLSARRVLTHIGDVGITPLH